MKTFGKKEGKQKQEVHMICKYVVNSLYNTGMIQKAKQESLLFANISQKNTERVRVYLIYSGS